MISRSTPEPLCDVAAQIAALRNPGHPKKAVWLARGTSAPSRLGDLVVVPHPAGLLLTVDHELACRFIDNPPDEGLASVLGYVEAKSQVCGVPVVVQALDGNGSVVTEMGSSVAMLERAVGVAREYGEVRVTSLVAALSRRFELCRMGAR